METIWQDLRYGLRVLRRNPAFTLAAVMSLALGIGANTAVFSIVHAVLLRPLPFPDAERLVRVARQATQEDVSLPEFPYWREHLAASPFSAVAGYRGSEDRNFTAAESHEWIAVMTVTPGFFATLGVAPVLGRDLETGGRSVVISDALWRRAFGSDPRAPGRVVTLEGVAYTVAGVLPRGFWFPQAADAFLALQPAAGATDDGANTVMIARLKPGIELRQAGAAMAVMQSGAPLSLSGFQEWVTGDVRANLLLLFGGVGLLLLIACANVASLVVARLATRQKEIAMRLALGSSRVCLLRQLAIENLLWGAIGAVAGVLLASWMLDGLLAVIPFDLPAAGPIRLNGPVLLFTLLVALCSSMAFSVAPVLQASKLDLYAALKSGRGSEAGAARQRTRSVLVTAEVAVSVALLASAALLIQSLYRMHREHLGFSPHGVITFYMAQKAGPVLMQRLQATPGVRNVAAVNFLPLTEPNNFPAEPEGHPEQSIGGTEIRIVTPDYFEAMRIPMVRGRPFNDRDSAGAPGVILVNEALARRWWGEGSALGGRVLMGRGYDFGKSREWPREVVGVAGDTKTVYLRQSPRPTVYLPAAQTPWYTHGMSWVVRTNGTAGISDRLRQTVAEAVPLLRVERWRTMDEIVASTTADSRFDAWLCGIFAGVALLLTATGIYGLLSFSVARRTGEIGTRLALGASPTEVLKLVLGQGMRLIAIGLIAGAAGAIVLTRSLRGLLFGVRPADPLSFILVAWCWWPWACWPAICPRAGPRESIRYRRCAASRTSRVLTTVQYSPERLTRLIAWTSSAVR